MLSSSKLCDYKFVSQVYCRENTILLKETGVWPSIVCIVLIRNYLSDTWNRVLCADTFPIYGQNGLLGSGFGGGPGIEMVATFYIPIIARINIQ